MSSLKVLKDDNDQVTLTMEASDYQKNTLLLDQLLVSDMTTISTFCHRLQDTEDHQELGDILVNGTFVHSYVCMYRYFATYIILQVDYQNYKTCGLSFYP